MVDFAALRKKANERAAIERGNAHTERIVRRKTQKELLDEMYSAMEEGALSFNAWEQGFIDQYAINSRYIMCTHIKFGIDPGFFC